MSSWLFSLGWIGGSVTWPGRCLESQGLGMPGVGDDLFKLGPGRLVAEPRPQIFQQRHQLVVAHAGGERRHDRATFARNGPKPCEDGVDGIARVRRIDGSAETEIDAAIG